MHFEKTVGTARDAHVPTRSADRTVFWNLRAPQGKLLLEKVSFRLRKRT
jgi:hypothetical protein